MGDAYVLRDRMRDLKIIRRASFCWPQLVPPERARRMLRQGAERWMMDEKWGAKVKWVSKMNPKMRGVRSRGKEVLRRETSG